MRNLLIVDDEKNIRDGIKVMIAREFPGIYHFFEASDGEAALNIARMTPVDVLITDIKMPVMDGIELIKLIQQLERIPAVIILSGYNDFTYAKEAIRWKVKEYLLKPIVRQELYQALIRLEQEANDMEEIEGIVNGAAQREHDFRQNELHYILLNEDISDHEIRERLSRVGLSWLDDGYFIGLIQPLEYKEQSNNDVLSRVKGILQQTSSEPFHQFVDKNGRYIIVSRDDALFSSIISQWEEGKLQSVKVGLSEHVDSIEHIKKAYNQASKCLKYLFLQSSAGVVRYENIKDKNEDYTIPRETIQKISNMLGNNREQEIKNLLIEVLDYQRILYYDISYLEKISKTLNELVFDRVFQVYGEESIEILKLYKKIGNIYSLPNFHDYFRNVESLLERLNEFVKTVKSVHFNQKEMKQALDYIHNHYNREISLATVSNHVSFNYYYFSSLFKDYTGESFTQYLKKYRISKAKELLEASDYKVYEISAMVGLENTKHFTKVFRESEGVTPLEYRNRLSGQL